MYELTEYRQMFLENGEDFKITVDSLPLDYELIKNLNNNQELDEDIIDVEFKKGIKKADKLDYSFAIFSGVLTFLLSKALNKYNGNFDEKNIDYKEIFNQAKDWYGNEYPSFEKDVGICFSNINKEINDAKEYFEFGEDFLSELSFRGIATTFINELIKNKNEDIEIIIKNTIVSYIFELANYYKENGKFKERFDTRTGYAFVLKKIKDVIIEISDTAFDKGKLDKDKLRKWFIDELKNKKIVSLNAKQNIFYVKFNSVAINTYVFIRSFCEQVKEHNINSLEGLAIIDFDRINNERTIIRLLGVSSGMYEAIDVIDASIAAFNKYRQTEDPSQACVAFVNNIDFLNIVHLTTIVRRDIKYVREDIEEMLNTSKVVEIKKYKDIPQDELNQYLTLNKAETRILYSLMLHMVEEDIQATKESKEQIKKNEWKKEWMNISKNSLQYNKLFNEKPEITYKALLTQINNKQDDVLWLYNIAIELSLFKPYYQLDEDSKKYKGLKLVENNYLKKYFCSFQNCISYKDICEIRKQYNKYYDLLDNKAIKIGAGAVGVAVIGGIGGGLAWVFAPQIAVTLFGGAYPALHGAALVNAALAAVGGGAIAAGGLGMAGGVCIIAGGGTLVGLGTSTAALLILGSPKTVQNDSAKLLTKCNYVLISKLNNMDAVSSIQKLTEKELKEYKMHLEVLESINDKTRECNETIKSLRKSISYTDKTNRSLLKMVDEN